MYASWLQVVNTCHCSRCSACRTWCLEAFCTLPERQINLLRVVLVAALLGAHLSNSPSGCCWQCTDMVMATFHECSRWKLSHLLMAEWRYLVPAQRWPLAGAGHSQPYRLFSSSMHLACRQQTLGNQFLNSIRRGGAAEATLAARALGELGWLYRWCMYTCTLLPGTENA